LTLRRDHKAHKIKGAVVLAPATTALRRSHAATAKPPCAKAQRPQNTAARRPPPAARRPPPPGTHHPSHSIYVGIADRRRRGARARASHLRGTIGAGTGAAPSWGAAARRSPATARRPKRRSSSTSTTSAIVFTASDVVNSMRDFLSGSSCGGNVFGGTKRGLLLAPQALARKSSPATMLGKARQPSAFTAVYLLLLRVRCHVAPHAHPSINHPL
jgi:hypothetical protein